MPEQVVARIPYLAISRFVEAWSTKEGQLKSLQFVEGAQGFQELAIAVAGVNDAVIQSCTQIGINPVTCEFPFLEDRSGPQSIREIIAIKEWLENQGIKIGGTTSVLASNSGVAAPKKPGESFNNNDNTKADNEKEQTFKIWDYKTEKLVELTSAICLEARNNPSAWPGCVEAGVQATRPIFVNHVCLMYQMC